MFKIAQTAKDQVFMQELETSRVKLADAMTQEVVSGLLNSGEYRRGLSFYSYDEKEVFTAKLGREIMRVVFLAIHGYTDWLAAKIWREYGGKLPRKVLIPVCDDSVKATIAARYSIDAEEVSAAIAGITENDRELPAVGRFSNGKIILNRSDLAQLASLYDWSDSA